jgi:hypothetical protein
MVGTEKRIVFIANNIVEHWEKRLNDCAWASAIHALTGKR